MIHILYVKIDKSWVTLLDETFNDEKFCEKKPIYTIKETKSYIRKKKFQVVIIDLSSDNFCIGYDLLTFLKKYKNLVKIAISTRYLENLKKRFALDDYIITSSFDSDNLIASVDNAYSKKFPSPEEEEITVKKILIASANPTDISLRLDKEMKDIKEGLKLANHRDKFSLKTSLATTPQSLQRELLHDEPHIFHFSGHGEVEGIILEDNNGEPFLVTENALANLFKLFKNIECVLLNACHTETQANAIVKHINYVIAMNKEIGDKAAIAFSVAFYDALGSGRDIEFSFESAKVALQMLNIQEDLTPVLLKRE